jgi:hypothetical protein
MSQTEQTAGRICFEGDAISGGGAAEKYTLDIRINKFRYDAPSVAFTEGPGVLYARIATRWATPGTRLGKIAGATPVRTGKLLSP